ncbi:MAG TPA: fluoride efflux transporter CrcB [Candidatus Polarisedimenticolia bacterium]|nr:fluoride efflux transporter CrcB [Candidatus Polarisedimenticolia bacterium]
MLRTLWIGLGGFVGTVARYLLGGLLNRMSPGALFPYETLIINVSGCLAIGWIAGLSEFRGIFPGEVRTVLTIGVLGGFTTFSSFGYETFQLLREGQWGASLLNAALQVVLGLAAVWAGQALSRMT